MPRFDHERESPGLLKIMVEKQLFARDIFDKLTVIGE